MLAPYSFENRYIQGKRTKRLSKIFKIEKSKTFFHIIGAKKNSKPAEPALKTSDISWELTALKFLFRNSNLKCANTSHGQ